jgi:hypothetical protein
MRRHPPRQLGGLAVKILSQILNTSFGVVSALAALACPAPVHAIDLVVVDQSMLQFVCMFDGDCSMSVLPRDIGALPTAQRGSDPRLQSFAFAAKPSSPAAGTTVYVYRVDLTKTDSNTECLAGVTINFGPPAQMPFAVAHVAHVFVITSDGHGTVAVKSAEQDGDFIQFNFDGPLCAGKSSMFFGLPSRSPPASGNVILFGYGSPPITEATAQTPRHERLAPPGNVRLDTL